MTNEEYSQFVSCLESKGRTELVEEQFLHAAVGLAGESGELLDKVKKVYWQKHPLDDKWFEDAILELGDILFYLQFMCNNLGVTLDGVRDENVTKLSKRYKDKKFTVKDSINRRKQE